MELFEDRSAVCGFWSLPWSTSSIPPRGRRHDVALAPFQRRPPFPSDSALVTPPRQSQLSTKCHGDNQSWNMGAIEGKQPQINHHHHCDNMRQQCLTAFLHRASACRQLHIPPWTAWRASHVRASSGWVVESPHTCSMLLHQEELPDA